MKTIYYKHADQHTLKGVFESDVAGRTALERDGWEIAGVIVDGELVPLEVKKAKKPKEPKEPKEPKVEDKVEEDEETEIEDEEVEEEEKPKERKSTRKRAKK